MKNVSCKCGLAVTAALLLALTGCGENTEPAASASAALPTASVQTTRPAPAEETTALTEQSGLKLPWLLEEAGLELRSCFASSVPNPDAGDVPAEDIASIELVNRSGRYLKNVFLTLHTSDDSDDRIYRFRIRDLPADGVVWAFELENRPWKDGTRLASIDFDGLQFDIREQSETVTVREEELNVTITNTGAGPLEALELICRCNFGEVYFGGISYCYPVPALAPGEQVTITAEDCYMGTAEAVSIHQTTTK